MNVEGFRENRYGLLEVLPQQLPTRDEKNN
jgi:hypothetical protein